MTESERLTAEHEAAAKIAVEKYREYMLEHSPPELIADGRLALFVSCFNTGYRAALIDVEIGRVSA